MLTTIATTTAAAAAIIGQRLTPLRTEITVSMTSAAARMSAGRRPGSFSRQRRRSSRILAGVFGGRAFQSGSCSTTSATVSSTDSASNARLPVSNSYSRQPNAQTSVRLSIVSPRACSGLMYGGVPRTCPARVSAGVAVFCSDNRRRSSLPQIALASPKSSTFTRPSGVTFTFAGFRSRWTIALLCAACNPSAIWRA